jgi:4-aminobutyrate aminotransferase-like enzyme
LLKGLEELRARHERIGDVRGLGLYLGIACDQDRSSKEPNAKLAKAVVEGMRSRGVLLSTDGMAHDVIKMKPPLAFDPSDAAHVLSLFDEVFGNV